MGHTWEHKVRYSVSDWHQRLQERFRLCMQAVNKMPVDGTQECVALNLHKK